MAVVLRELLRQGHSVQYWGLPGFSEAPSLLDFPNFRYSSLRVAALERAWGPLRRLNRPLPNAAYSQFVHVAYHREAIHRIEQASALEAFDVVLCADTMETWPSRLPVISWPQSAPQTEWAALRSRAISKRVRESSGDAQRLALDAFYAYRWLQARVSWRASDLMLCGSKWSERAWQAFGVPTARIHTLPYPLDLATFTTEPPSPSGGLVTFLWLGRATPRKRFDLFLAGFEQLAAQRENVRAIVIGNLAPDPLAERALAVSPARTRIEVRPSVPRTEVPALLRQINVVVQPSESENFGFSVAEALASGRPVVAGPTNGTAEYAGEALFPFHMYTPSAVAQAMLHAAEAVIADPPAVARRARAAAARLAPERIVAELVTVCERVIERRGAGWPTTASS